MSQTLLWLQSLSQFSKQQLRSSTSQAKNSGIIDFTFSHTYIQPVSKSCWFYLRVCPASDYFSPLLLLSFWSNQLPSFHLVYYNSLLSLLDSILALLVYFHIRVSFPPDILMSQFKCLLSHAFLDHNSHLPIAGDLHFLLYFALQLIF